MSTGTRAEPQFEDLANQHVAGRFAMWVFIGSEVLFFAALGALYFGFRAHYLADFEAASHHAKLVIGSTNTFVLLTSSLCVVLALEALRAERPRLCLVFLAVTLGLAVVFLALKATEYVAHFHEGILPGAAYRFEAAATHGAMLYFTLYYAMTGLHALHVLIGIGLFSWTIRRIRRGLDTAASHAWLEHTGLYWHFVDIVWLFLWPMFYLLH